jgi:hypothetical protein
MMSNSPRRQKGRHVLGPMARAPFAGEFKYAGARAVAQRLACSRHHWNSFSAESKRFAAGWRLSQDPAPARLDDDEKGTHTVSTPGSPQGAVVGVVVHSTRRSEVKT